MKFLLLLIPALLQAPPARAYYGEDNRKDLYDVLDPKLKKAAAAIAYQVEFTELSGWKFKRLWKLVMEPSTARKVCENEKFSEQLSLRNNCTAVLVSPKHLLTAGNCITDHYCWNGLYYWMFDYTLARSGPFDVMRPRKNFYTCEKIVKRVFDPSTGVSYTLLELDKEVAGIEPLKLRQTGDPVIGEKLVVLGHPEGMPLKIADGTEVYDQNATHFTLNSDISGESLGSAVINAKTYDLEGILIYGTANYSYESGKSCKSAPRYPDIDARELAIKASVMKDLVNTLSNQPR